MPSSRQQLDHRRALRAVVRHQAEDVVVGEGQRAGRAALAQEDHTGTVGERLQRGDLGAGLGSDEEADSLARQGATAVQSLGRIQPGVLDAEAHPDGRALIRESGIEVVGRELERGFAGAAKGLAGAGEREQGTDHELGLVVRPRGVVVTAGGQAEHEYQSEQSLHAVLRVEIRGHGEQRPSSYFRFCRAADSARSWAARCSASRVYAR